jgi:WD40 repeat protein
MVLSPDGTAVACRTRNTIRIYPAAGVWKDVPTITNDGKQDFTGIAYHPSGRFLAATSNDKTVKLYDAATGLQTKAFTWDIGRTRSIAFSPDGLLAAAGSDTGKVVVWDVDV